MLRPTLTFTISEGTHPSTSVNLDDFSVPFPGAVGSLVSSLIENELAKETLKAAGSAWVTQTVNPEDQTQVTYQLAELIAVDAGIIPLPDSLKSISLHENISQGEYDAFRKFLGDTVKVEGELTFTRIEDISETVKEGS